MRKQNCKIFEYLIIFHYLGKTGSPVKIQDEIPAEKNNETDDCLSPELPHLKTVNLQSLLRGKGTIL